MLCSHVMAEQPPNQEVTNSATAWLSWLHPEVFKSHEGRLEGRHVVRRHAIHWSLLFLLWDTLHKLIEDIAKAGPTHLPSLCTLPLSSSTNVFCRVQRKQKLPCLAVPVQCRMCVIQFLVKRFLCVNIGLVYRASTYGRHCKSVCLRCGTPSGIQVLEAQTLVALTFEHFVIFLLVCFGK